MFKTKTNRQLWQALMSVVLGVLFIVAALVGFGAQNAKAASGVPLILNYEARVTNASGSPIIAATDMRFIIYDSAAAGNCVWSGWGTGTNGCTVDPLAGAVSITPVAGGFSIALGDTTVSSQNALPSNIFNDDSRYLEVRMYNGSGWETLAPRKHILSAPYAFNSNLLNGLSTSAVGGASAFVPVTDSSGNLVLTKNVTFDTDTFFVDSSAHRVGIGTTVPGAKLEVSSAGGTGSGISLKMTSAGSYGTIDFNTPTGLIGQFVTTGASYSNGIFVGDQLALASYANNGSTAIVAGGSNGYINFATGGYALANERMRIDKDGKVGIGTTTPAVSLDVAGSARITGGTPPATGAGLELAYSTDMSRIYSYDRTGSAYKDLNLNDKIMILANGNVGIGTTSPGSLFQIGSAIAGAAQTKTISVQDSTTSDYANLAQFNSSVASVRAGFILSNSSSGAWENNFFQFMVHGSTFAADNYLNDSTSDAGLALVLAQGSQITKMGVGTYSATPLALFTNNTQRVYITSDGKIGIGTTSPSTTLDVYNSGTSQIRYRWAADQSLSFGGDEIQGPYLASHTNADGTSFGNYVAIKELFGANGFKIQTSPATAVGNVRTFTDRFIVEPVNGNVGIGYTDPGSAKLAINGNVGIGTTTPLNALSIVGPGNADPILLNKGMGAGGIKFTFDGTNYVSFIRTFESSTVANNYMSFGVSQGNNTTESVKMIIKGDGNVGIGTTSPSTQLEVSDDGNSATKGISIAEHTTGIGAASLFMQKSRGTGASPTTVADGDYISANFFDPYVSTSGYMHTAAWGARVNGTVTDTSAPTDLWFSTSGGASDGDPYGNNHVRMVILANGNVGVGTTAPSNLLTVTGDTDGSAIGPIVVKSVDANSVGTALTLDATPSTGGHKWSFLSTGPGAAAGAGAFSFYDSTAGAYRATITTAGAFQITGGATTVPLSVSASNAGTYTIGTIMNSASNVTANTARLALLPSSAFATVQNAAPYIEAGNAAGTNETFLALGTYNIGTGLSAERMRIDKDGNVGIGQTVPTAKLSVVSNNGTSAIDAEASLGNTFLGWRNYATHQYYAAQNLAATTGDFQLYVNSNGADGWIEAMHVQRSNGYVGIGDSSPSALLSVGSGNLFTVDASGNVSTSGNISSTGSGAITSAGLLTASANLAVTGTITGASASASALAVGANGATNPVLQINAATGSVASGLLITGGISGGTTAIAAIDSGANSSISLDAKGTGTLTLNGTATGGTTIGHGLTLTSGTTLTLTGDTVAGTPTWSSNQAITLSTASQPNITSVGTLSSLGVTGAITGATTVNTLNGAIINSSTQTFGSHTITDSGDLAINSASGSNLTLDSAGGTSAVNVGTANATSVAIGNATGAMSLGFTSGTGSQTFTSSNAAGITTGSSFVFTDAALTSGTLAYFSSTSTSGKLIDMNLTNTSGTIINAAYSGTPTQTAALTGLSIDFSNLRMPASEKNLTGISIKEPPNANLSNATWTGLNIFNATSITESSVAADNWYGVNVINPSITQNGSGALVATGINLALGEVTTAGTQNGVYVTLADLSAGTANGINIDGSGSGIAYAGTLDGLNISNLSSNGAGTENAIQIGTGWDTSILGVGALTITSGSGTNLTLDSVGGTSVMNIGTANATSVSIGRTGQTTTVNGSLTVSQLLTASAGLTLSSGTLTLTGDTVAGAPTWSSSQAITLSTAAQTAITSVGTLSSLSSGAVTVVSTSATALSVAASGSNYGLQVDESTSSAVTGLKITPAAAGAGLALAEIGGNTDENLTLNAKGAGTITLNGTATGSITLGRATTVSGALTQNGAETITSTAAGAFVVGANGATNPVLQVNAATGSVATGLLITGGISGGTTAITATDSGPNSNISLDAKGSGTVAINGIATGVVTISHGLTVSGAGTTISGGNIAINNSAGSFTTSISGGSSSGAVTIGNSSAGALALASGTSIVLTSSGLLTLTANAASTWKTSTGALTVDAKTALNLGTSSATSVSIGKAAVTTTVNGPLTSVQLLTGSLGLTVTGAATSISGGNIAINNLAGSFTTSINNGTSTGAISIGNASAGALTLTSGAASTWSTSGASSTLTITSGSTSAPALTLSTAAQASGATGGIAIATGNAASGTAGNIALDVGSSSTGNGTINIGTTRLETVNIGTGAFADVITIGSTSGAGVNITGSGSSCVIGSGAGPTNCTSDARLKQNVVDLGDDTLTKVLALRPVDFNWNALGGFDQTQTHIGLIAQEVQQQFPNLVGTVYTDPTMGEVLGVDYQSLVVPSIKAIQEQQAMLGSFTMTTDDLSKLVANIQTEAPHDPVAIVNDKINNSAQFLTDFVAARVTAIRGYFDEVFMNKSHQKVLCVGDAARGGETCINKDQLDQLLSGQNPANAPAIPAPPVETPPVVEPPPVATTPTPDVQPQTSDTSTPTATIASPDATTTADATSTPTATTTAPDATAPITASTADATATP